jgi:hypothetical protein
MNEGPHTAALLLAATRRRRAGAAFYGLCTFNPNLTPYRSGSYRAKRAVKANGTAYNNTATARATTLR